MNNIFRFSCAELAVVRRLTKPLLFALSIAFVCFLTVGAVTRVHADVTPFTVGPIEWQEGVIGQSYSLQLQVSGGTAPYTWSVASGTLPDGLSLDSSTGLISGTPTTLGSYTFTAQAQDANSDTAAREFTLAVYPSVGGFSYSVTPSGSNIAVNVRGVFGADFCDSQSSVFGIHADGPSGFATNVYSSAVALGAAVDQTLTFTNLNPGTYSLRLICLSTNPNAHPPSITLSGATLFTVGPIEWQEGVIGQPYSLSLQVSGGTAPYTWSVTSGFLPAGLNLNASTGLISGTPTTVGSYTFTAQTQDANGGNATRDFTLAVYPSAGGFSHTVTPSGSTITVNVKGIFGADFCDSQSSVFGVHADGPNGFATNVYSGAVALGTAVNQYLTLSNLNPGTYSLRLICLSTNSNAHPPSVSLGVATLFTVGPTEWQEGVIGQAYSLPLQVSGGTAPYTWSLASGALPTGLNLNPSTGLISGTPTATGSYTFTAQAQDTNGGIATRDFALSVYPSAGGFSYNVTTPGSTVTINVKGVFGADFCNNKSYAVRANADGPNGNGFFSNTIVPAIGSAVDQDLTFSNLGPGTYSLKLVCSSITGGQNVIVPLNGATVSTNQPPVLSPIGNKTVNENTLLQFTLSATDPDNDTLTYSAANLPSGASFDSQTRTFSWTPSFTQEGNYDNIEFTVSDNGSPMELDVELITITVGNVNRAPVVDPVAPQEVLEEELVTFTVSATDLDADTFTLSALNLPAGASFTPSTGIFSWTPTLAQSGSYVVTFQATDIGVPVEIGATDVIITVGDNPTPTEQTEEIINTVVDTYDLPTNIENAYMANLKKVVKFIEEGKINATIGQLNAFIDKVEDDYVANQITQEQRDTLVGLAEALLADLQ